MTMFSGLGSYVGCVMSLQMVVTKQDNAMERLQTMLAESLVKSQRIEQEQEKKSALRHNKQMEEIRNRHVRERRCRVFNCLSLFSGFYWR